MKQKVITKIPRIIHYCWFGGNELSKDAKKTIDTWKINAPDFEIRCCNETNFDVTKVAWTKAAYTAKKYAFVSDYARFKMLYEYGGIYMDLGSRLIKDVSELVDSCSPFSAIEEITLTVNPGLIIAAAPRNELVGRILSIYEKMDFVDEADFLKSHTVNSIFTNELKKIGYEKKNDLQKVGEWTILSSEYFNPIYGFLGFHIKKNTYSIHFYSGSWLPKKYRVKKIIIKIFSPFIGRRASQILGRIIGEISQEGLVQGCQNSIKLILK